MTLRPLLCLFVVACATQEATPSPENTSPTDFSSSPAPHATEAHSRLPYPITVQADLTPSATRLPAFTVVPADAEAGLARLATAFDLRAPARPEENFGGLLHIAQGERHAYAYDQGGLVYHDIHKPAEDRLLSPASPETLWAESEALLSDLGLLDHPFVSVIPFATEDRTVERYDAQGNVVETWVNLQRASYTTTLEGLPCFGGGSDITVYLGDDGVVVGLTSALRELVPNGDVAVLSPAAAVEAWLAQAEQTGRLSVHRIGTPELQPPTRETAPRGPWMSPLAQPEAVALPTYALKGTITYGAAQTAPFTWYQPAVAGTRIAEFAISG